MLLVPDSAGCADRQASLINAARNCLFDASVNRVLHSSLLVPVRANGCRRLGGTPILVTRSLYIALAVVQLLVIRLGGFCLCRLSTPLRQVLILFQGPLCRLLRS